MHFGHVPQDSGGLQYAAVLLVAVVWICMMMDVLSNVVIVVQSFSLAKGHGYRELLCTLSEFTFAAPFEINVFVQPFCWARGHGYRIIL